jgi:hypothetical protein
MCNAAAEEATLWILVPLCSLRYQLFGLAVRLVSCVCFVPSYTADHFLNIIQRIPLKLAIPEGKKPTNTLHGLAISQGNDGSRASAHQEEAIDGAWLFEPVFDVLILVRGAALL